MTQEEQDAVLGRTRREYRETRHRFGALKKVNSEIAAIARDLAAAIEHNPERLFVGTLPRGSVAAMITDAKYVYTLENASRLSPESLVAHLQEYIKIKDQKEKLRQELIEQGDDPGEVI